MRARQGNFVRHALAMSACVHRDTPARSKSATATAESHRLYVVPTSGGA